MKRQSALLLVFLLLLVGIGIAVALPASPIYLPKLLRPPVRYEGQTLAHWLDVLQSPEIKERQQAAHLLGTVTIEPEDADEAVTGLTRVLLTDPDKGARIEASLALTKVKGDTPALARAVPDLARALEDKEVMVRMNTARVLLNLGGAARPAVPALLKALQDKANDDNGKTFFYTVKEMAALALGKASAGTAEAVPALRELLAATKTSDSKHALVRAIGFIGPEARPALPDLRGLLTYNDAQVHAVVEEAIRNIEGGATAAK
jgi:HEAT repeat protein